MILFMIPSVLNPFVYLKWCVRIGSIVANHIYRGSVNYYDASSSCNRSVATGYVVRGQTLAAMVVDSNEDGTRTT